MKYRFHILTLAVVALLSFGAVSCSDDDLGTSIFDTHDYPLDRNSYTFPLDTFVKVNFLEPYNLKYIYKMEDIGSDMQKNLVPATYDESVNLAVLSKYLWYDVYVKCAGIDFVKLYSPRIIHVIGSPAYNPASGTETLGEAEGGLKITLYNANNLDVNDIDMLNEKFFKTMHHEFGHILAQNHTYPTAFSLVSNGLYSPIDWQNTADSIAASQGFVSPYASSQAREDWVEVIANYIVKDSLTWNGLLNTAKYDWETADVDVSTYDRLSKLADQGKANRDSIGYMVKVSSYSDGKPSQYQVQRKVIERNAAGNAVVDAEGKMTYLSQDNVDGSAVITQKLEMCREWLKSNFNVDLDAVRREVQQRQWVTNPDGTFKFDENGKYINRLTYQSDTDPAKTFMDTLVDEVNKYKTLQGTGTSN